MDKRKLAAIPRAEATPDMLDIAGRLGMARHIVTAELLEDGKILLLYFYEIETLSKGKTEAAFRTFLSKHDYITQALNTQKVRWKTASFYNMDNFSIWEHTWNHKRNRFEYKELMFIRTNEEKELIAEFFKDYNKGQDSVWKLIHNFQNSVMKKRLEEKHKKETDAIDAAMKPFQDAPQEFFSWIWETGMRFSRYLIYKENKRGKADCVCTYCGKTGIVDRKKVRLRNNEKGFCHFCKSPVTFKAKGMMGYKVHDKRWIAYIDPTEKGFYFRYFHAHREIFNDSQGPRIEQFVREYCRVICTFSGGKPIKNSY